MKNDGSARYLKFYVAEDIESLYVYGIVYVKLQNKHLLVYAVRGSRVLHVLLLLRKWYGGFYRKKYGDLPIKIYADMNETAQQVLSDMYKGTRYIIETKRDNTIVRNASKIYEMFLRKGGS